MMTWLLIILGILLVLFIILVVTKIKIEMTYKHNNDDDLLKVDVYLWWMRVYAFEAPLIKLNDESPAIIVEEEENIAGSKSKKDKKITIQTIIHDIHLAERWIRHIVGLNRIVRRFLRHIHFYKFDWYSEVGVGDAAFTGSVAGVVWSLKGSIVGLVGNHVKMHRMPNLSVTPHFQAVVSHTYFSCMFTFRIGHAIFVGLLIVMHWKRRPKWTQDHKAWRNRNM
ncbi:DUF2953 domain-containing protein [Alkalihalophilus lindianensis]|uniref:DUF2953 domain-containing protein n=1 Tax=Alkalihalophilus lindianensis TaxID=1630542 RepID=A0ABU3XA46_9BACI|nr:DUF2953 domain-containing protein [Alkalihalophilus lindianensis]MDV2684761.1 DUF2953 domain-containing protein [Alkalihalophilus lindianensis]